MGAVIHNPKTHRKIDVVSPLMAPPITLVDPEMTATLPPGITAATGMDALTHGWKSYTATLAHPLTDAIHRQAIELLGKYLLRAYREQIGSNAIPHDDGDPDRWHRLPEFRLGRGAWPGPPYLGATSTSPTAWQTPSCCPT